MNEQANLKRLIDLYDDETIDAVLAQRHRADIEPNEIQDSYLEEVQAVLPEPKVVTPDGEKRLSTGQGQCVCLTEQARIEAVIGESNFLPAHFLEAGARTQRAVARIALLRPHRQLPVGSGWGSGFLVSPSLLMTNNHVIADRAFASNVHAQFNFQNDENNLPTSTDAYAFEPSNFFYTNPELDFTLIRLRTKCTIQRLKLNTESIQLPFINRDFDFGNVQDFLPPITCRRAGDTWGHLQLHTSAVYSEGQRVNIIQHPQGRRKEITLQDNTVSEVLSTRLRYISDTDFGSSGSPVFNNSWQLICLHHARTNAGGEARNQGIRIDSIIQDLRDNVDADILSELNI